MISSQFQLPSFSALERLVVSFLRLSEVPILSPVFLVGVKGSDPISLRTNLWLSEQKLSMLSFIK
jgi:hypothetical protein